MQPLTIDDFIGKEYDNVRCKYFYAAEKWRKAINDACKVDDNDIGVVYILGDGALQIVKNYTEKKKRANLIVFYLDGMSDWLEKFTWWNEQYAIGCKIYCTIYNGKINEKWVSELEKMVAHHGQLLDSGNIGEWTRKNYDEECEHLHWLDEGDSEVRRLWQEKVKGGWRVICGKKVKTVKEFVLATYPYGIEVATENEKAYKPSPTLIREIGDKVLHGYTNIGEKFGVKYTGCGRSVQISFFDDNIAVTESVAFVKRYIQEHIAQSGYFNLFDLVEKMKNPPYGYYVSPYYAYVVCVGIYEVLNGQEVYYTDGIWSQKLDGIAEASKNIGQIFNILNVNNNRRKPFIIYQVDKDGEKLNALIADIFGIKKQDTLAHTCIYARRWCEEHLVFPISVYSQDIYEVLDTDDFYHKKTSLYYARLALISGKIKSDLQRIDDICIERYAERAGREKAREYYKYLKGCGNTARTWAYPKAFEFEHFDRYAS